MIVDTHCHAWRRWPYDRGVPDTDTRGSIDSLLYEMDTHGVGHATVVCARIGGGAGGDGHPNEDNNEYVLDAARRHPDRVTAWIDVDCMWRPEHHTPGAAGRLRAAIERSGARGFTHYVSRRNDGWLRTDDAAEFFAAAEEMGVVASLAVTPEWFDDLDPLLAAHSTLAVLLHHMGTPVHHEPERAAQVAGLLGLAGHPNVGVKVSGFNYNAEPAWEYPYPTSIELFRSLLDAYGPDRLYWGSDFPASRDQLTYTQALEVVRTHCAFAGADAIDGILGENAARLIALAA